MSLHLGFGMRLITINSGRGWSPATAGGLVFDLDPSRGVMLATTKVSSWADQSVTAGSAAQGTDANRPTFVASDINGRPGVRGAAAARLDVSGFPALTAATYLLALTRNSLASAYLLSGAGGNFGIIEGFTGSSIEWFTAGDRLTFVATPTAGAHVLGVTQTNGGALTLYYDGAQAATKATAATNLAAVQAIFNVTGGATNGFNGDLLRMSIFNRVFSAAEISQASRHFLGEYT